MTNKPHKRIAEANQILVSLGLPRAQQNERSALCLLSLLNLTPRKKWTRAENPLIGITPIMDWARKHYQRNCAAISRAYEMCQEDRNLLAGRNLAATVERTAELLKEDATFALDFFMAKQAESQAVAGHRLNLIAAIFFPILAFSSIFGMSLVHGFEDKPTWLFWLFVVIGIGIGALMTALVFWSSSAPKARGPVQKT